MKVLALLVAASCSALAGEYALLASGARLHVDRHVQQGARVVLYSGSGTIEMDSSQVTGFEPDHDVPAAPPAPAAPAPVLDTNELIRSAAKRYGLEPKLLSSIVRAESGYHQNAVSRKGALGLMQLLPSTAQIYGANPRDARQNVEAGTRYFTDLLRKYNFGLYHALAAYNAGPGAVDKYHGIPPYAETRDYINRIMRNYQK